jgi:molecular chaperone DnaJ
MEKLEETLASKRHTHSPQAHSFWDKVKSFFSSEDDKKDKDSPWE